MLFYVSSHPLNPCLEVGILSDYYYYYY